jgi:hypothetical protein
MASKAKQLRMKLKAKKIEQEEKLKNEENNLLNNDINNNDESKPEQKIKLKEISISSSSENENDEKKEKKVQKNNNNIILVEEEIDPLNYFDVNHINIDNKNPVNEITEEIKKKDTILSKKTTKNSNSDIESKENDFYQSSKLPIIKNKKKKKLLKMNTINLLDDNNDNFKNNINKVSNHRTSISFGNMKLSILDLMEAKEGLKTNEEVEKTLENLRNSERIKIEEEKKREKEKEKKKNIQIENENNNNNDEFNELDEKKRQIFIDKVNKNIEKTQERIKQIENFSSEEIQNKIDEIKKLKNFKDFEKIKNILLKSELPEFLFANDKDIQIIKENEEIKIQKIKIDIIQLYNNK